MCSCIVRVVSVYGSLRTRFGDDVIHNILDDNKLLRQHGKDSVLKEQEPCSVLSFFELRDGRWKGRPWEVVLLLL